MLACVRTAAVFGVEASVVQVEVDVSFGLPTFGMVGLPDASVRESRDRVKSAIRNSGYEFPPHRVTVNLAPADVRKAGSAFDLPIALGILAATGLVTRRDIPGTVLLGELSLDGAIQPVRGVLPVAAAARRDRCEGMLLPARNAPEASVVAGLRLYPVGTLQEAVSALNDPSAFQAAPSSSSATDGPICEPPPDFADVLGQALARRALEIAAAGGHNLLMIGPPGAGKSMLAQRLPGLLPPLDAREALELSMVQSLAGELSDGAISRTRPFRNPHHSASMAALVGGGLKVKPGEVSLAHLGVLFLDELPEFQRGVLDSLRQPIETGEAVVARANAHVRYPARFQLIAAMNPCRCGYLSDPAQGCGRAPKCAGDYQSRISGPLFDRIDLHVEVQSVSAADLSLPPAAEGNAEVAARVRAARSVQRERFQEHGLRTNAEAEGELLDAVATPDDAGKKLLTEAAERMKLSARGYHRVLKVARTIADLAGAATVAKPHVAEALSYRRITHLP